MSRREAAFAQLAREVAASSRDPLLRKAEKLLGRLFRQQRALITDRWRRKALLCPRRAGKSFALAVYLLWVCLTIPSANCVFIAITREKSKQILWLLLKRLDKELELGASFNESALTVTFSNGSRVRLAGCETSGDIDKFRGEAFHLVVLDESKSWHAGLLDELLTEAIEPALGDFLGTLVMAGTPGAILAGPFYQATGQGATAIFEDEEGRARAKSRPFVDEELEVWRDVTFEWSFHSWTTADNTAQPHIWLEALALKQRRGWTDEHPIWVREYLGRWMADDTKLVWRYAAERDDWEPGRRTAANPFGLPENHAWRYVISCDLGFHDPFGLQVGAYSDTHPNLFHAYEDEEVGLSVGGIAKKIRYVLDLVGEDAVDVIVGDLEGLGGAIVATLAEEYGIVVEKADKKDKRDNIEILNGDFVEERCKVLKGSKTSEEMTYLAWDPTGLKEKSGQKNNLSDAFLYMGRRARHRDAREPEKKPAPGSPEYYLAMEAAEEAHVVEEERRQRRAESDLETGWGGGWRNNDNDWFSDT